MADEIHKSAYLLQKKSIFFSIKKNNKIKHNMDSSNYRASDVNSPLFGFCQFYSKNMENMS